MPLAYRRLLERANVGTGRDPTAAGFQAKRSRDCLTTSGKAARQ
jgi:hypothetical protein